MKQNFWMKFMAPALAVFLLAGCDKNDPVSSDENSAIATEDAAESIASAVGSDNGGAMDQLSDVAKPARLPISIPLTMLPPARGRRSFRASAVIPMAYPMRFSAARTLINF
jgi:hypothetical protein